MIASIKDNKVLFFSIIGLSLIKILLLPYAGHPFDFWTFVTTIQKNDLYGLDLFKFWNKGNLLVFMWYFSYKISVFFENILGLHDFRILILHFFFKLPFFFIDVFSGIIAYQVVLLLTENQRSARLAFCLWYFNPIIYYVYGIHGHYEILVPFSFFILIRSLLLQNAFGVAIACLIGFTTKYFVIIFFPFIYCYLYHIKSFGVIIKSLVIIFIGLIFSYFHFFVDHELFQETINSINNLAHANAPESREKINLNPLNLISVINFIFKLKVGPVNNVDDVVIFSLGNSGFLFFIIFYLVYFIKKINSTIIDANDYSINELCRDFLLLLCAFLILIPSFQAHYLCWLLPYLILMICSGYFGFIYSLIALSVIGFFYCFKNELGFGVFFIDFIGRLEFAFGDISYGIVYLTGTLIIFIIMIILLQSKLYEDNKIKQFAISSVNKYGVCYGISLYFYNIGLLWIIILNIFIGFLIAALDEKIQIKELTYAKNSGFNKGILVHTSYIDYQKDDYWIFTEDRKNNIIQLSELLKISQNNNIRSYLLVNPDYLSINLFPIFFNECKINYRNDEINNKIKVDNEIPRLYKVMEVDISCIKSVNKIKIKSRLLNDIDERDIYLYLTNQFF